MKFVVLLFLFMLSFHSLAASQLEIVFSSTDVNQGSMIRAKLIIPPDLGNLQFQKLKAETFGETIYFQQVSPLLRKENSSVFESEIQVIFTSVPKTPEVQGKIGDEVTKIFWENLRIHPVETPSEMIWADFTAPDVIVRNLKWLWVLFVIPIAWFASFFVRKRARKKKILERKKKLAAEIQGAKNYEEIVSFWKKKHDYIKEFPHLAQHLDDFESVLFKCQFKPTQTESEKNDVLKAYRKLMESSEGGFRGV